MSARERMLKENNALGTAAFDANSPTERARAVIGAEHVLRAARRALEAFGPVAKFRDTIEAKLPSGDEKRAAVKLAQAAALVEAKTTALESVLKDESVAVVRIERAQLELAEAQKSLTVALEQRERVGRSTDAVSIAEDRAARLASFKAAIRGGK